MSERPFPVRPALLVSAALNVLLIGAAVGGYATGVRLERPLDRAAAEKRLTPEVRPSTPEVAPPAQTPATTPAQTRPPTRPAQTQEIEPPPRGGFMRALPPDVRAVVRRDLALSWAATRPLRLEARAAREAVRRAGVAEFYDEARMRAALARMRASDLALQAAWQESIAHSLSSLEPAQRRIAVEALARERRMERQPGAPPADRMNEPQPRRPRERWRQRLDGR